MRRDSQTVSQHHSVLLFITPQLGFPFRSKAVFNAPEEEDIGIYSCLVTHTDGASSSYTLSDEGTLQSPKEKPNTSEGTSEKMTSASDLFLLPFIRVEEAAADQPRP